MQPQSVSSCKSCPGGGPTPWLHSGHCRRASGQRNKSCSPTGKLRLCCQMPLSSGCLPGAPMTPSLVALAAQEWRVNITEDMQHTSVYHITQADKLFLQQSFWKSLNLIVSSATYFLLFYVMFLVVIDAAAGAIFYLLYCCFFLIVCTCHKFFYPFYCSIQSILLQDIRIFAVLL